MIYAKIEDGILSRYPYTMRDLKTDNPNTSFRSGTDLSDYADYGVVEVTLTTPPEFNKYEQQLNESVVLVDGVWTQTWTVEELPDGVKLALIETKVHDYIIALEAHQNAIAQERLYYDRITCALRSGYSSPYQEEGQAFAMWMDQTNYLAYKWLNEMQAGTRPWVSQEEFIAMFPVCSWDSKAIMAFGEEELETYEPAPAV